MKQIKPMTMAEMKQNIQFRYGYKGFMKYITSGKIPRVDMETKYYTHGMDFAYRVVRNRLEGECYK